MMNKIIFCLFLVCVFNSCDVINIFGNRSINGYSLITLNQESIPNESFFYVNLYGHYYTREGYDSLDVLLYAMDEGPGVDCKISVDQESSEDLYCLMDAMEGDMYFHEVHLEYNVPPGMCDYLTFSIPWHFNQEIGQGPSTVYQCDNFVVGQSDEGSPETETRYCLSGCKEDNRPPSSEEGAADVTYITGCTDGEAARESIEEFCGVLNREEGGLSNCCLGEYNVVSPANEVLQEGEWGGNFQNCIGGLAKTNWTYFIDDYPVSSIENVLSSGYSNTYGIPAIINVYGGNKNNNLSFAPSFINANYWTDVSNKNFLESRPEIFTAPQSFPAHTKLRPIEARRQHGYPYFTWACLDKAREVKHRIHLLIRDWNTQEEFTRFKETEGSRGDADVEGEEGSFCKYYEAKESGLFDSNCNDLLDLDDWENTTSSDSEDYAEYPRIIYSQ